MDIRSQLTIIIPTHCRHALVERALTYYKQFQLEVIVVDSSPQPMKGDIPKHACYLHYPGKSFAERIEIALGVSDKPFVALCADDDFLAIDGVTQGIEYLMEHADYSGVNGRHIQFYANAGSIDMRIKYAKSRNYMKESDDPMSRVFASMNHYTNAVNSVFRAEVMEKSIQLAKVVNHVTVVEISIALVSSLLGKTVTLPVFWMARDSRRYSDYRSLDGRQYQSASALGPLAQPTLVVTDWAEYLQSASGNSLREEFGKLFEEATNKSAEMGVHLFDAALKSYYVKHNVSLVTFREPLLLVAHFLKKTKAYIYHKILKPFVLRMEGYPLSCSSAVSDWRMIKRIVLEHEKVLGKLACH